MKRSLTKKITAVFMTLLLSFGINTPTMVPAFAEDSNSVVAASQTNTDTTGTSSDGSNSQSGTDQSQGTKATDSNTTDSSKTTTNDNSQQTTESTDQTDNTTGADSTASPDDGSTQTINVSDLLSGDQISEDQLAASLAWNETNQTGIEVIRANGDTISEENLQGAVNDANASSGNVTIRIGGTITIDDTNGYTINNVSGRTLTIEGVNNGTIQVSYNSSAANRNRVDNLFEIQSGANVVVNNLNIHGPVADPDSSGNFSYSSGTYLNQISATFDGERAFFGDTNSNLTFTGTTTVSNFARFVNVRSMTSSNNGSGAAVCLLDGSTLTMQDSSSITNCIAESAATILAGGGAIGLSAASLNMEDTSSITHCHAVGTVGATNETNRGCGSAVYYRRTSSATTDRPTITIGDNATISDCQAHYGGTIYYSGTVTINVEDMAQLVNNTNYGERAAVLYADCEAAGNDSNEDMQLNITGNSCISGNSLYGGSTPDATSGTVIGDRTLTFGHLTIRISDQAKINNNSHHGYHNSHYAEAICLYENTDCYISGNVQICNNTADASNGSGIAVRSVGVSDGAAPTLYLSGAPTITGNGYQGGRDVSADQAGGSINTPICQHHIRVGQLTGGRIGFHAHPGEVDDQDGVIASAVNTDGNYVNASTVNGNNALAHIFNNDNSSQFATAGVNSHIIWGSQPTSGGGTDPGHGSTVDTCQIIRHNTDGTTTLHTYHSLDLAAQDAQDNEVIEVYASHTLNGTALFNHANVTVRPAPIGTPTWTNSDGTVSSHTRSADDGTITITRNTTVNDAGIVVARQGTNDTGSDYEIYFEDMTLNMGNSSDTVNPGVLVRSHLHLNNVTVQATPAITDAQGNTTSEAQYANELVHVSPLGERGLCDNQAGICYISPYTGPGVLYVQNTVNIKNNQSQTTSSASETNALTIESVSDNNNGINVSLPPAGNPGSQIQIEGALGNSSIGVTMQDADNDHKVFYPIAVVAYTDSSGNTPSGSQFVGNFFDDVNNTDTTKRLPIGGGAITGSSAVSDNQVYFGDMPVTIEKVVTSNFSSSDVPDTSQKFTINVTPTSFPYSSADNVIAQTAGSAEGSVSSGAVTVTETGVTSGTANPNYVTIRGLGPGTTFTIGESNLPDGWTLNGVSVATGSNDSTALTAGTDGTYSATIANYDYGSMGSDIANRTTNVTLTNYYKWTPPTGIAGVIQNNGTGIILLILVLAALGGLGYMRYMKRHRANFNSVHPRHAR